MIGEFIKCGECSYNNKCKARTNDECKDTRFHLSGIRGAIHMFNDETVYKEIVMTMEDVVRRKADERSMYRLKFFTDELYRRVREGNVR